jgi:DNA-directed RNA polymerase subunit M/transcription elongation factor TFIIS
MTTDYQSLIPKHQKRKKIYNTFYQLLKEYNNSPDYNKENTQITEDKIQKMALNIERGIFNYALHVYTKKGGVKSTYWCDEFKMYYMHRTVIIYNNLNYKSNIKNTNLIKRFFNNDFNEFELVKTNPEELFPEKYAQLTSLYGLDKVENTVQMEVPDGIFKCRRCQSYKTTYYQLQTRSADESLTTYVNCTNCGNKWKFC